MGLYKLLKDEEFKALDQASRTSYYYEKCYVYPAYRKLPFTTLYHLKDFLTNRDVDNIIEWYRNGIRLNRYKNCFRKKSSSTVIKWDIDSEIIKLRKALIEKEITFRKKIIDENKDRLR